MVHIAIIGVYCIIFSLGCYYFLKHQCKIEMTKLKESYEDQLEALEKANNLLSYRLHNENIQSIKDNYAKLEEFINKDITQKGDSLAKNIELYLSEISDNVSSTMEEIKQDIKKKPVI